VTFRTIVTGASSGIGRATALLLARDHHALILNARREQELTSLAEACLAAGACSVSTVVGDIGVDDTSDELADTVDMSGQGEIVLVNNAGWAEFGPFHEQPIETALGIVDATLGGAMQVTRALLPKMLMVGRGTVVNVVSIAVRHTFPNAEAYTAAKSGLLGFSKSLNASYRSQGIRVTALIPGAVDTPLWKDQGPDKEDMLKPQAVAETIKWLIDLPRDRAVDEIVLTPPKGVL
jgi:short-subunit dehydrogenase